MTPEILNKGYRSESGVRPRHAKVSQMQKVEARLWWLWYAPYVAEARAQSRGSQTNITEAESFGILWG
jgi:hypothetical protein